MAILCLRCLDHGTYGLASPMLLAAFHLWAPCCSHISSVLDLLRGGVSTWHTMLHSCGSAPCALNATGFPSRPCENIMNNLTEWTNSLMYCEFLCDVLWIIVINFDHIRKPGEFNEQDFDQVISGVGWDGWFLFGKDHSQQNCQAGPNLFGKTIRHYRVTQVISGFMIFMCGFEPPNFCDCCAGFWDVQSKTSNVCPALRNAQKKDEKSLLGAILLLLV